MENAKMYMNIHTGSVDDREGWELSYGQDELDERGLTREEAFDEDEGGSLIEVVKDLNGNWIDA